MVWYLLNFAFLCIMSLTIQDDAELHAQNRTRKRKFLFFGESLIWILLSGLRRWDIGEDTSTYAFVFEREKMAAWSEIWQDFVKKYILRLDVVEPGFKVIEKTVQMFTQDYQVFLVIVAVVFFTALAYFLSKYSRNAVFSYILFSGLFFSFYALTGTRQTLATAIVVLWGTELIRKRKLFSFLLITCIAATIHTSVLCFVPFYWISQIKITRKVLRVYWILIALSYAFRYRFFSVLQFVSGYEKYDEYAAKTSPYTFLGILLLLAVFCTIFYKTIGRVERVAVNDEDIGSLDVMRPQATMAINALFMACIFSSMVLINPSCMRVVHYYSLFLMILLPECCSVFTDRSKGLYTGICMAAIIVLFLCNRPVYYFFWQ